jgi:diguanylate cyclase (GGDEF)-like protein/PAS domain S-box-containing protein
VKRYRPFILLCCALAFAMASGAHSGLQRTLSDARFALLKRPATGGIAFVAVDSPSIEHIGVWPWPRQTHARLLDELRKAGAATIAFDIDFSSPSKPAADAAFAAARRRAGGSVVLPVFQQVVNGPHGRVLHASRPLPQFARNAWTGLVNVSADADGIVRRYPYGQRIEGQFVPSLGAMLASSYNQAESALRIDFAVDPASVPTFSYGDVLSGKPEVLARLKGKAVIVGAQAIELGDRLNIPGGRIIPGAMLQALAAESILQHRALHAPSPLATGGLLLVILALIALTWRRLGLTARTTGLLCLSAAAEAAAIYVQSRFPVVLDTALVHIAVITCVVAGVLDEVDLRALLSAISERRFHRIAMSLGDGLVCIDHEGLVTFCNRNAASIFGYAPDELVGLPAESLYRSDDPSFSLVSPPNADLQATGGVLLELDGRRKGGEIFPLEVCISEWQGMDGRQYGAIIRDITERKREAARVLYLAEHDSLTGLLNRNKLHQLLSANLTRQGAAETAVLMLDLDKFKHINDTLGHASGDSVLRGVAQTLRETAGPDAAIARLGGDEFVIVLHAEAALDSAKGLAERLCDAFRETLFAVGVRQLRVDVSAGIAGSAGCRDADELLGNADLALYQSKARGRGGSLVFEPAFRSRLENRLALEAELVLAADNDEFELFYQPQIDLSDGCIVGAEALIRWRHPERGIVLPDQFMPVVNASSISDAIGLWAMRTACAQARRWERQGHPLRIAVNLAPSQFLTDDLPAIVQHVLGETELPPHLLELEVTENILIEDDEMALGVFRRIQKLGVHIAFDDFGTGYGSLISLKKFPLNRLKIDKSFVMNMRADPDDMAIVSATIGMARLLGLAVIAEGIEDADTAAILAEKGCHEGQGYLYGRPMPASDFERLLGTPRAQAAKPGERTVVAA